MLTSFFERDSMRLGGPVPGKFDTPEAFYTAAAAKGFRAVYCPVGPEASDTDVRAWSDAAAAADIVIAEVGAWSNPISKDKAERAAAMDKCKKGLELAERIGARCCVNITGSRGPKWDGPCAEDLTPATFDLIVACVQEIIDAVKPSAAFYTLETMPWMYPDSVQSYADLLKAIDRPACAVHFDPVNLVCSPQRYFNNGNLIREFFRELGPQIKSCHAKDIKLADKLTTHLDEVRPGEGRLDYAVYLQGAAKLDPDLPVMLEHLPTPEEYDKAAAYIRKVAGETGVAV